MFNIFLLSLAVDENVIQVCLSIVIETFKEGVIDVMLKEGQFIKQVKRKNIILVHSYRGAEGSEFLTVWVHSQFVEDCNDVKLNDKLAVSNLSQSLSE